MRRELTIPVIGEVSPRGAYRFYRGKATRALAEARVVNETGVVRDTMPLEAACAAVLVLEQFLHMLRR